MTTAGASCKRSAVKANGQVHKSQKSCRALTFTESSGQDLLTQKATMLVESLLYQYKGKKPIKKAGMLKIVHKWFRKDFLEILRRVFEHMNLIYGLELREVKPNGNSYTLTDNQDDTSNESLSSSFRFPKKGILMPLLGVIFLNGNHTSEEEIWKLLNIMGIYDGKTHFIFEEPRQLITQDLVQEKYLVYWQVPDSDPPCYEFLWGPRAQAETSKMKILEFWTKLNDSIPPAFVPHYEELKDEEERAQTRAQVASMAGTLSQDIGSSRATSSCNLHHQ
ncbi:LOW QUALITY PROTEIN: melanoma-associated antigen B4-like [Molossus nigricans]